MATPSRLPDLDVEGNQARRVVSDNGKPQGPEKPHCLGQGDAEDHQGHADGCGGETAPCAGSGRSCAPYAERMGAVLANLSASMEGRPDASPLMAGTGKDDVHLLVVCTAERGLCGGFNGNIAKLAREHADR
jgi:hypothetical protein